MAAVAFPSDYKLAMVDSVEAAQKRQTAVRTVGPETVKARALANGDAALKLPFGRSAKGQVLKDVLLASNSRAARALLAKRFAPGLPPAAHGLLFNALNVETNSRTKSVKVVSVKELATTSPCIPGTPRTDSTEASSIDSGAQVRVSGRFSTMFLADVPDVGKRTSFKRSVTEPTTAPSPAASQASDAEASKAPSQDAPITRSGILGYRLLQKEKPAELRTLTVQEAPERTNWRQLSLGMPPPPERASMPRQLSSGMPARQVSSGGMGPLARQLSSQSQPTPRAHERKHTGASRQSLSNCNKAESFEMLTPSSKAYQARGASSPSTRLADLRRSVQSSLNKICPENISTISVTFTGLGVRDSTELEAVIELIFKKAITEPHYCETYADLVFTLKQTFPEFPSQDGGRPITFRSSILNICQAEFEALPKALDILDAEKAGLDDDEISAIRKRKKDRVLANMKFIGHLFLRQLLSSKVIGSVLRELVLCDSLDEFPEEHAIECCCELLMSIGYTLEALPAGPNAIQQVCGRLMELKKAKRNGRDVYCKRVQFLLQDLLDTRAAGWTKKLFRTSAKTKGEIRTEQQRDIIAKEQGADLNVAEVVIAGQRPVYMTAVVGA